jgi:hypothetical protein
MSTARLNAVDKGLPRRLSLHRNDPHYDPKAERLSDRVAVLIDGVELAECASWDVDKGVVTRRYRNHDGHFVFDDQGLPRLETLKGEVEVRWAKESVA